MKKLTILIICVLNIFFLFYQTSFANPWDPNSPDFVWPPAPKSSSNSSWWSDKDIKVKTTEKVPWANCVPDTSGTWTWEFICTITPWFSSVQSMVWQIIKYFTWLAALAWVLFIVVNWMLLSMWWDWADEIKKRIKKTIMWLILLLLSWVILYSIAPWIYK